MTLLALLVSTDDTASQLLGRVLPACGIAVERFSAAAGAVERLRQQKFDALVLDFDDPNSASAVIDAARQLNTGKLPISVALVTERLKTRDVLGGGAHFVLYK